MDLAQIPSYVNVVVVSFAKPDCAYVKGSLDLAGTGMDFSSSGPVVKDAIVSLKQRQPNTRVLLAVGGATYTAFDKMNTQCIKDLVDDFGERLRQGAGGCGCNRLWSALCIIIIITWAAAAASRPPAPLHSKQAPHPDHSLPQPALSTHLRL
jgi:hypothetical protein